MKTWLLLAAAIVSEVTGSLSLKGALTHRPLYALVAAGFVGAFALLHAVLRRGMPLALAYGVWSACGVILTTVLSTLLFAEPLTPAMTVGVAMIVGGVLLVESGSRPAADTAPATTSEIGEAA